MEAFLSGLGVALITPFTKEKKIDFKALENLFIYITEKKKIDYIVLLGSTSEFPTLREGEKKQIIDHILSLNTPVKIPLVLGLGGNSTEMLLEKLDQTDLSHFQAILSTVPHYNKPSQEGLYSHFEKITTHTSAKLILYNIPSRTGVNLLPSTLIELASNYKNIIGVKESSGDINQIYEVIELKEKKKLKEFKVISGDDHLALPSILAGASGVISVIAQAIPDYFSLLIKLSLEGKSKESFKLFYKISPLLRLIYEQGNPTGIKMLLKIIGKIESQELRLPLIKASDSLEERLNQAYLKNKTLLF